LQVRGSTSAINHPTFGRFQLFYGKGYGFNLAFHPFLIQIKKKKNNKNKETNFKYYQQDSEQLFVLVLFVLFHLLLLSC